MRACPDRLPHHTGDPKALTLTPQHPQERITTMNKDRLSEESVFFTEKELRKQILTVEELYEKMLN